MGQVLLLGVVSLGRGVFVFGVALARAVVGKTGSTLFWDVLFCGVAFPCLA